MNAEQFAALMKYGLPARKPVQRLPPILPEPDKSEGSLYDPSEFEDPRQFVMHLSACECQYRHVMHVNKLTFQHVEDSACVKIRTHLSFDLLNRMLVVSGPFHNVWQATFTIAMVLPILHIPDFLAEKFISEKEGRSSSTRPPVLGDQRDLQDFAELLGGMKIALPVPSQAEGGERVEQASSIGQGKYARCQDLNTQRATNSVHPRKKSKQGDRTRAIPQHDMEKESLGVYKQMFRNAAQTMKERAEARKEGTGKACEKVNSEAEISNALPRGTEGTPPEKVENGTQRGE